MTLSEEEDELLTNFLESELSDEEEPEAKRLRIVKEYEEKESEDDGASSKMNPNPGQVKNNNNRSVPRGIESGTFSKIPPELFTHILKFLSSEDLVSCSLVCSFLNYAASDESLWRRLYCKGLKILYAMGFAASNKNEGMSLEEALIQRDEKDMIELFRNCPSEFKEYHIQMQAAKRGQTPSPSLVKDDSIILDKTVADQVSMWKSSRGLTDKVVNDRACSGETCTYNQIGDAFVCEKTGQVHVCDDTCRKSFWIPTMSFWSAQFQATVLIGYNVLLDIMLKLTFPDAVVYRHMKTWMMDQSGDRNATNDFVSLKIIVNDSKQQLGFKGYMELENRGRVFGHFVFIAIAAIAGAITGVADISEGSATDVSRALSQSRTAI
ncbi:glycine-rich protein A3-like [Hibiscus syriacus]|uniref:Glycine-rich protein A3-like n=1 Tax=Hibiscus syriacus TaxID=106335 RepID=A0A6A2WQ09_HIBSY|nr:glycine-rich protein A3-like [Hibiscus syriacus]